MGRFVNSSSPSPGDVRMQALVLRFQAPLRSYFRKRVYEPQEAEDLVQEVFCRIAGQSGIDGIDNPDAYVFQIAANLLRDRARRESTRAAAFRELGHRSEISVEELSPERVLQGKQGIAAFERALTELPERTRTIFVLHRFEELKYSEIARRLGISISGVEKHMMDALRHVASRVRGESRK